jgi:hypothetical protein
MAETRRKFDQDFREGAERLVRETGKPIAQVARDLGIILSDEVDHGCDLGSCVADGVVIAAMRRCWPLPAGADR